MDDPTTNGVTEAFGLMFYNARWYDPYLNHFTQPDSIVPGGVQGMDRYAYVNNNPIRYNDPSGHAATPCIVVCPGDDGSNSSSGSSGGAGGSGSGSPGGGSGGSIGGSSNSNLTNAQKKVMSLLGFTDPAAYLAWAIKNPDYDEYLQNVTPGSIVRVTVADIDAYQYTYDFMVVAYNGGYAFYSPSDGQIVDGSGLTTSNIRGLGVFNLIDGEYLPGANSGNVDMQNPPVLQNGWNIGENGAVTMDRLSNTLSVVSGIGVGTTFGAAIGGQCVSGLGCLAAGIELSGATLVLFFALDQTPTYHPGGLTNEQLQQYLP